MWNKKTFSKMLQGDSELTWDKAKKIFQPKKGTAITLAQSNLTAYSSTLIL